MTTDLEGRVAAALARSVTAPVRAFAAHLATHRSDARPVAAALFYGSNLRTGSLEGVLDFYILTTDTREERIWPRVSYHEWEWQGVPLRAKVATMNLTTFAAAARGDRLDTTIWARFVQPAALAWQADDAAAASVVTAVSQCAATAARLAVALGPQAGTPEDYWRALFRATYAAEFRVEKAGREDSILSANRDHFDGLLPLALLAQGIDFARGADSVIRPHLPATQRLALLRWWRARRRMGKPLNVTRLLKASTTFEGAARYAAWKIERHTGIVVALTPWRERHPVLAAPGVLWRLWRARRAAARSAA
ncbi:hypothetical protein [Novosphingobium colocasiae]|uniref:Phosphatidate cytidylyltransferase n=1 Tax=Novosphingobium colocasiae TaxID=1256513 RepID=A0A918UF97_9SPHN|nr:hypothetical protein [Novosphingobium colocasiae]GGY99203.1 hypothetical protein GCM10011614_12640 [Novosphingobium colocasiae]